MTRKYIKIDVLPFFFWFLTIIFLIARKIRKDVQLWRVTRAILELLHSQNVKR